MTDDISKVVEARQIIDEFIQCINVGRWDGKLVNAAKDWLAATDRLESATTPAEVGEVSDGDADAAARYIRDWCPDSVKDYVATLARQLAEAKVDTAKWKSLSDAAQIGINVQHKREVRLQSQLAEATRRLGEVEVAARQLRSDYARMLETARDRIRDLGGECDPVDVMERADPALRAFDAALQKEPTA